MKIEIDNAQLIDAIVEKVVEKLIPLLRCKAKDNELMGVEELAKYLNVGNDWVYAHVKEIPHYKIGRFPKFRKKLIDKWLEKQRTPQNIISNKNIFST